MNRAAKRCLFSAPFDFLGGVVDEFAGVMETEFREIWDGDEVTGDSELAAWIVNPGQRFVTGAEHLARFPALEVLITPSTGVNHIDLEACRAAGIPVLGLLDERETLETITASAEFTFFLILCGLRDPFYAAGEVTAGRWRHNEDRLRGRELHGRSVGLVGMGRNGTKLARWCAAFDAEVSYADPYVTDAPLPRKTLEEIFADSDVVCLCCTLSDETTGMIDRALLERLKPGAVLVNTSRGEVIKEADLIEIIAQRPDIRVCLDVIAGEVTDTHFSSPLVELHREGRILVMPHIAGATVDSQTKAARAALKLLDRFYAHKG